MKRFLILKLLAVNLAVIGFFIIMVYLSIDTLAAGYFVTLMEKYGISPEPAHAMFLSAVHRKDLHYIFERFYRGEKSRL